MRHIVNNPYHLWAHQSQSWAANSTRNRSFDGKIAKSYAAEIARIVTNSKGKEAFMLSTRTWSVTTSKHQSEVRQAVRDLGKPVFHVYDTSASPSEGVKDYMGRIQDLALKMKRARSNKEWHEAALQRTITELREFVAFFKIKGVKIPTDLEAVGAELEKIQSAERKREREAAAKLRRDAQESIDKWIAGDPYARIPFGITEAFMRVVDDQVQTSMNAVVPLEHVARAVPIVMRVIRTGGTYNRLHSPAEIRLGHYRLDSIDAKGNVRVGCHYFTRAEVERFAGVLKTTGVPT